MKSTRQLYPIDAETSAKNLIQIIRLPYLTNNCTIYLFRIRMRINKIASPIFERSNGIRKRKEFLKGVKGENHICCVTNRSRMTQNSGVSRMKRETPTLLSLWPSGRSLTCCLSAFIGYRRVRWSPNG